MKIWKKLSVSATVAATLLTTTMPAHALFGVGDVVFDPTSVYQAIQQYYQLQQQYQTMQAQLQSMSGQFNVAAGTNIVKDYVPGSWQDVFKNQSGAFGNKQQAYDKLMQVIPKAEYDKMMSNGKFSHDYNTVRMGMAVSEVSFEALNEHIKNLQVLSAKINQTKGVKESMDLGNQISVEQTYISAINARLGAVQANLSSTASNNSVSGAQTMNAWNK